MKTPDKIYVASYNGEAFSHSWTIEPLGDTTATEYIRKDVLIEWLEGKVNLSYGVATDAFVEVIDKLKLL